MTLVEPIRPGPLFDLALRRGEAAENALASLDGAAREAARLALWRDLCALGWPTTLSEEADGGAGAELADLAEIIDGAGRSATGLPLPTLCALVPLVLGATADAARRSQLVEAFGAGELRPALGLATSLAGWTQNAVRVGTRVSGFVGGAEAAPDPTHLLLVTDDGPGRPVVLLTPLDAPGVTAAPNRAIDGQLTFDIQLDAPMERLASGTGCAAKVQSALAAATLATCVEAVAGMAASLSRTVDYLNQREQFGAPLSSFQVLRHAAVDMYVEHLVAASLTREALAKLGTGVPEAGRALALAKYRTADAARRVAQTSIQLHGGMGITEELAANRLNKRLLAAEFAHGDGLFHADALLAANEA